MSEDKIAPEDLEHAIRDYMRTIKADGVICVAFKDGEFIIDSVADDEITALKIQSLQKGIYNKLKEECK